jgi:hypothetical protein
MRISNGGTSDIGLPSCSFRGQLFWGLVLAEGPGGVVKDRVSQKAATVTKYEQIFQLR